MDTLTSLAGPGSQVTLRTPPRVCLAGFCAQGTLCPVLGDQTLTGAVGALLQTYAQRCRMLYKPLFRAVASEMATPLTPTPCPFLSLAEALGPSIVGWAGTCSCALPPSVGPRAAGGVEALSLCTVLLEPPGHTAGAVSAALVGAWTHRGAAALSRVTPAGRD